MHDLLQDRQGGELLPLALLYQPSCKIRRHSHNIVVWVRLSQQLKSQP